MRVLIACEFSGTSRRIFRTFGHEAWSCDLIPSDDGSPYHIIGNVLDVLRDDSAWDLMIAHPPCTYLCNSGVHLLDKEMDRKFKMHAGAALFKALLNWPTIPRIAVENPIMHGYAKDLIGTDYTQMIQPYDYGHGERKSTCLWLKNLPELQPTRKVSGRETNLNNASPGPDRWKIRSTTFPGISIAMAEQWGEL